MIANNSKTGFTLIELLVVISIIGLLSSVVLASLNSARTKGADATVKTNLVNLRTQAALYYNTNASYGGLAGSSCSNTSSLFADPTITSQITGANNSGGGTAICANSTGILGTWAIAAKLKSGTTDYWCVDSAGNSKLLNSAPTFGATPVCP